MRAEARTAVPAPPAPARSGAAPPAAAPRLGPELARTFAADAAPACRKPVFAARGDERSRVLLLRQLQRTQGNRAVERWLRQSAANEATAAPAPAVGRGPVAPAAAPLVQRDAAADAPWWKIAAFGESVAWKMAEQFAPQLVPVLRRGADGMMDWLKARASGAADAVVDGLMSPVRAITGVGGQLSAQFAPMLGALQDAATKIAANDCSPIGQAADKIEKTAEKIVGPIVEKLQPVVAKVQGFLGTVWDKIGAPIWDWIKDYAGQQWDMVKQLAGWVWSLTEPMRSLGADAWTWLKNRIGIGDGPQGENGVLQWLQGKFEAAWQSVKTALAPFTKQLGVVRAALGEVADTFTGGVARVGTLVGQVGKGLGWIASNIGNGKALIAARSYVEKSLIPPLIDGLHRTSSAVTGLAASVGGALHKVAVGLDGAAGAVAGSVLHVAASAVQWIAGEVTALAGWAGDKLQGVATWLESAIGKLQTFLHGVVEFLAKVGGVVADVWRLPMFLAEKVWNWIPACIRDPVVDFVVPIILRQIELFEELVRDNDAWQKTKVQVMGIVRLVFVNHDLAGAVKACFNLLLRVLNIPPDMLGKVAAKAMAAWDVVSKKPLDFIKNTVRSLGHGFKLLWANIGTHMEHGIEGWLFGELSDKDIHPPKSWGDPKAIFGFVVEVLGLSIGHVTELLKKRIDPKLVDKVQGWIGRFSRAWDWVTHVIDTSKSPAENTRGVIDQAKDFGKSILTGAVEWIAGRVATELAVLAAGAAASGGLSEVLDVARRIYKAMLTAKRWAGRILQMASDTLDHVLDIASGNVGKVGGEFEKIMDKAMPVVIGFLADQVGLGGIGTAIRNIVDSLRAKVDAAILWLIDKVKGAIEAVLGGIKAGVGAVAKWWQHRESFDSGRHSVYFAPGDHSALMVASVPTPMFTFLSQAKQRLAEESAGSADPQTRAKVPIWTEALKEAQAIGLELRPKVRRLQDAERVAGHEHTSEVDDINKRMRDLSRQLNLLVDLVYPPTAAADTNSEAPTLKTVVKIKGSGRLARIDSIETENFAKNVSVAVSKKMVRLTYLTEPKVTDSAVKALALDEFWKNAEKWDGERRARYMGPNPLIDGPVGWGVQQRLIAKDRLRRAGADTDLSRWQVVDWRDKSKVFPFGQAVMGHLIDAVSWWNTNGRFTGMRSKEVDNFMNEPANYELEEAADNSRRGRELLSYDDFTYLPPVK